MQHRVAVVDDDPIVLALHAELVSEQGYEVRTAEDAESAIRLVELFRPHLVLLDYRMPDTKPERLVQSIRAVSEITQIILVTAATQEAPPRRVLAELDIQGYHSKGDGSERLLVLVEASLKHYRVLEQLSRERGYLQHILEVAPEITRLQPIAELLDVALKNVRALLQATDGVVVLKHAPNLIGHLATEHRAPLESRDGAVSIQAGVGRFSGSTQSSELPQEVAEAARLGLDAEEPTMHHGCVLIPLRTRFGDRGCMVLKAAELSEGAARACRLFSNQIVQAFENAILYDRSTTDALTKTYNRAFGIQRLEDAVRLASRTGQYTSLILFDLDHFKVLNDKYGHRAGDMALRTVASLITQTCRATDVVSRYGGEEILVVLPATDSLGARTLAERIVGRVRQEQMSFEGQDITVTVSGGVATTASGESNAEALLQRADSELYRAKASGRDRICSPDQAAGRIRDAADEQLEKNEDG